MKIRRFILSDNHWDILNAFLNDESIVVKKVTITAHDVADDYIYIFYEDAGNILAAEKEELNKLDKIAQELEKDEDYAKLKNSTQRTLYLLSKHRIPSGQAAKVIELVNMRKILQERK